eukprot:TRINITY_DN66529_c1_g1_i4.p1 TRINITY_DN66529_c1_g1~~TRINITY_DN66529_c1_g1_i4.p1  ORF type:complete len:286 (+),score=37.76 TRINITY_DN66529_c1_g1_i4:1025-1882(+)
MAESNTTTVGGIGGGDPAVSSTPAATPLARWVESKKVEGWSVSEGMASQNAAANPPDWLVKGCYKTKPWTNELFTDDRHNHKKLLVKEMNANPDQYKMFNLQLPFYNSEKGEIPETFFAFPPSMWSSDKEKEDSVGYAAGKLIDKLWEARRNKRAVSGWICLFGTEDGRAYRTPQAAVQMTNRGLIAMFSSFVRKLTICENVRMQRWDPVEKEMKPLPTAATDPVWCLYVSTAPVKDLMPDNKILYPDCELPRLDEVQPTKMTYVYFQTWPRQLRKRCGSWTACV